MRTSVILGAILWAAVSLAVGYLLGSARQFSRLPVYHIGQEITHDSTAVTFIGWSAAERGFRWAEGPHTQIVFRPEALDPNRTGNLRLTFAIAFSQGRQPVTLTLNGQQIAVFVAEGGAKIVEMGIPRSLLKPLSDNVIEAQHPDARRPSDADARKLAFAIRSLQFAYVD